MSSWVVILASVVLVVAPFRIACIIFCQISILMTVWAPFVMWAMLLPISMLSLLYISSVGGCSVWLAASLMHCKTWLLLLYWNLWYCLLESACLIGNCVPFILVYSVRRCLFGSIDFGDLPLTLDMNKLVILWSFVGQGCASSGKP